ncbi:TPR-like protein [Trichoderma camerunense]
MAESEASAFPSVCPIMFRTDANDENQDISEQAMLPKAEDSWHNSPEQCLQILGNEDDLEKMESIHNILVLLRASFPKNDGVNHFYPQWDRCAALHPHIQTLRDKVAALKPTEPMDNDDQKLYTELILNDIWYTIEIQQFLEAERSLLSLLETAENGSVLSAKVHRSLLGLYERTGRSILAKSSASSEFAIVSKNSKSASNDVANAWSNMGYARVSAFEASDGIPYLDKAISVARSLPEPSCYQEDNIDRFLRNRGRANQQMRRFEDALRDFDEAEYYQKKIHGPKSHYDGETQYERAKIEAWRGNLEEAYSLATKAHDLVPAGKPTHASVMAAQYRLGWIAMLQGKNDLALQHFEKSLVISRINEQHRGNSGESARIQWRMSQVLERMGSEENALSLREAAVKVKASLLATGDYAQVEDEDDSWDALVGLLYR